MNKKGYKRALSFFMAILMVILPSSLSTAKNNYTGFKDVDGKTSYFSHGQLVKNRAIRVNNGLYLADAKGRIISEVILTSGMGYELKERQDGYMSAYYALEGENKVTSLDSGNYYIYRITNGAVNLSKEKNSPGAWVKLEDSQKNMRNQFKDVKTEVLSQEIKTNGVYKLTEKVEGYISSYDARNGDNPVRTVYPGNYYIYKIHNGAINVSTIKGEMGAWIYIGSNKLNDNSSKSKTASISSKVDANASQIINGKFKLGQSTAGYMSAEEALSGENPVTNVVAGTYFIYKEFNGSLNISNSSKEAGAWINPKDVKLVKVATSKEAPRVRNNEVTSKSKTTTRPVESKPVVYKVGGVYTLKAPTKSYLNSYDAKDRNNSVGLARAGNYYIYSIAKNGAINISISKKNPGAWVYIDGAKPEINEDVRKAPTTSKNNKKKVTLAKSSVNKKSSPLKGEFVLVLDPGHGPGIASNRGGVLFNEGDQNFEFSRYVIKEANKYKNVKVITTRTTNGAWPGVYTRAKMGAGADLFLSLHTNAVSSVNGGSRVRGVEVINSSNSANNSMAYEIASMVSKTVGNPNRGVKYRSINGSFYGKPILGSMDYYGSLRNPNTAKTRYLIEFCFHTSLQDSRAFLRSREQVAKNLMEIVARNYNLEKK